jgi:ERCC4-type nuclease
MPAKFPGTIKIDKREKLPYKFAKVRADKHEGGGLVSVPWEFGHLVSGDYSIDHHEWKVAVERKSKADLYGTLGKGRARFERELDRLNDMDAALVLVESELSDVLGNPPKYSRQQPKAIYRIILAYQQRFPRVHWLFVPGREFAEATVFRYLQRYLMEYEKGNK